MGKINIMFGGKGREEALLQNFSELGTLIRRTGETFGELTRDTANAKVHAVLIREIEHQADKKVARIFEILDQTSFFSSLDHEDFEKLAKLGDSTIDAIWHASNLIANDYELTDGDAEFLEVGVIVVGMYQTLEMLFENLTNLNKVKTLQQTIRTFHEQENRTDELRDSVSKTRFATAKNSASVRHLLLWVAWEKVFAHIEDATDLCVDITDVLSGLRRKYWKW